MFLPFVGFPARRADTPQRRSPQCGLPRVPLLAAVLLAVLLWAAGPPAHADQVAPPADGRLTATTDTTDVPAEVPPQAAPAATADSGADEDVEPAIVAIEVTQQPGDWYTPWQRGRPGIASGSGFIVGPGHVMTNAHVVSDAKQIIVRRNGDERPYFAGVAFIAHDADLALLRVADPAFSAGVTPLQLGDGLPSLRSRVRTYGFPAGGEKISRTEGVVSRIQFITYLHSGADAHLAVQTDSAINPGNSGGPVVQEGRVVGVAFQASTQLNDVGYIIPVPVVRRFLRDVDDGRYDGYGELGLMTSNLINPVYREYLGLADDTRGVVVDHVLPGGSAADTVRADDVILTIDGAPVSFEGTVRYEGRMLNFEQIAEDKQVGDTVTLGLWRDEAPRTVQLTLKPLAGADDMRARFDELPPYVVYAGLVFMRLDRAFLQTFGNYWENADKKLLYDHFFEHLEQPGGFRTHIVLSRVLPHGINSAYRGMVNRELVEVNGVAIHALADIGRGLAAAQGDYHHMVLQPGDLTLVLERKAAEQAQQKIMAAYGIPQARRLP